MWLWVWLICEWLRRSLGLLNGVVGGLGVGECGIGNAGWKIEGKMEGGKRPNEGGSREQEREMEGEVVDRRERRW